MRKSKFSSYFFLRSYVALAAAILIIALALDSLLVWLVPVEESQGRAIYAPSLELLGGLLLEVGVDSRPAQIDDSRVDIEANFTRHRGAWESAIGVPLALYQTSDFAGQEELLSALRAGDVVSLFDPEEREILYRHLADSPYVLALGPLSEAADRRQRTETFVIVSYYLLVAVILYLWVRPFYRDLTALRLAASQFGREDFATRVEVDEKSSIRPVAQSFNKMAERIQYLVTAHRELTNAVSHELRTPLARFKFSMEMLGKTTDQQKKADYLASMKSDVQELELLIDEMLTYARLSEENLQLSRTEVALESWLERQLEQYSDQPIKLVYHFHNRADMSPRVSCNPDMLARALHNILRNGLRYATVTIEVAAELTPGQAVIRIADDGPGIPEDKHESVFEPFARLDTSRDRQSGGYGLGLAIAQRILQRHGGGIRLEKNRPQGACFQLYWPLASATEPVN